MQCRILVPFLFGVFSISLAWSERLLVVHTNDKHGRFLPAGDDGAAPSRGDTS